MSNMIDILNHGQQRVERLALAKPKNDDHAWEAYRGVFVVRVPGASLPDDAAFTTLEAEYSAWKLATGLASSKNIALAEIDRLAEAQRERVLTPGAGQAMTYQRKEFEARAFLADASPVVGRYPHLEAEVGITGPTLADVANAIIATADAWATISAGIEKERKLAKIAVAAAASAADVTTIMATLVWPS